MIGLIVLLLLMAYGFGRGHKINRIEGSVLLSAYIAYNAYLIHSIVGA